jgi:hypothetical protein
MQVMTEMTEINGQAICERALASDSRIKYSSYISSDGSRVGESMNESIVDHDKLTVMVLPLRPSSDVLVLAASPGSNLSELITIVKLALA